MLWFHQSPFIVLVHGAEVLGGGRGVGRSRVYNRSLLKCWVQYNQVYANKLFGREIHSRTESVRPLFPQVLFLQIWRADYGT